MAPRKPLDRQVVVLAGATGGVGPAAAQRAARRGAALVLLAPGDDPTLDELAARVAGLGACVIAIPAQPSDPQQLRQAAHAAIRRFGGFDTWVNVAAGSADDVAAGTDADRALVALDRGYWAIVHGAQVAAEHLRQRGGTIVNVASEPALAGGLPRDRLVAYRRAIRSVTDALRLELEQARAPVSVTLVLAGALTSANVMSQADRTPGAPRLAAAQYAPDLVAAAIVGAAEHPRREIVLSGMLDPLTRGAGRAAPRSDGGRAQAHPRPPTGRHMARETATGTGTRATGNALRALAWLVAGMAAAYLARDAGGRGRGQRR